MSAVLIFCGLTILFASVAGQAAELEGQTGSLVQRFVPPLDVYVKRRYLNLPVKNGGAMKRVRVKDGNRIVCEFDIELAEGKPDFWVFLDVGGFAGRSLRIDVDGVNKSSDSIPEIIQSNDIFDAEDLYQEAGRPLLHFTSRRGWLNDPNGLVYHKGEYHLFYQHNPFGVQWGNMSWGHAVSKDLVHWTELPIAMYCQAGDMRFSGSAVVDKDNTSGFKNGREEVIVAVFTSTGRGECIAYSNDLGRTFVDYNGNAVVHHVGRDPKVFWYPPGKRWVMAVYSVRDEKNGIAFYTSSNLKDWEYSSFITEYFECPEIFELTVDGNKNNKKWVIYSADNHYKIGSFDGTTFVAETGKYPGNHGNCLYAAQTFNNLPAKDGRRIQIGWARGDIPNMPFNQMMTFPVELSMRTTEEGMRMFAQPVREIENLHAKSHLWKDVMLKPGVNLLSDIRGESFDVRVEFEIAKAASFGYKIGGVEVLYDFKKQCLSCLDKSVTLKPVAGKIRMQILVDRSILEIFGNDGRVYMPMRVTSDTRNQPLEVFSRGGDVRIVTQRVFEIKPAFSAKQLQQKK